ncbi:phage tail protein [Chitinophaga sp. Hz27]|uniref:phage tail protein n=1 Tax=Chitinophaga sp. Hz27 TaxID=3347169 RepID=UPI0035D967FC
MPDLPYLGEICIVSFNFAPKGWALCNGQLLPINQNQALFSILGTTYGGNGQTNFALPNFQCRIPLHQGNGHFLGELSGSFTNTLTSSQLPSHGHPVTGTITLPVASTATAASPVGALPAPAPAATPHYSAVKDEQMMTFSPTDLAGADIISSATGGNALRATLPYNNMMPTLALTYIIALQGVYPSQT